MPAFTRQPQKCSANLGTCQRHPLALVCHSLPCGSLHDTANLSGSEMDTLQHMRIFSRVVEAGSFTAAARHLDATTASMSRAVSELETHLRARLLNRTTRRIALTEEG